MTDFPRTSRRSVWLGAEVVLLLVVLFVYIDSGSLLLAGPVGGRFLPMVSRP